jgi:hypothetical protein
MERKGALHYDTYMKQEAVEGREGGEGRGRGGKRRERRSPPTKFMALSRPPISSQNTALVDRYGTCFRAKVGASTLSLVGGASSYSLLPSPSPSLPLFFPPFLLPSFLSSLPVYRRVDRAADRYIHSTNIDGPTLPARERDRAQVIEGGREGGRREGGRKGRQKPASHLVLSYAENMQNSANITNPPPPLPPSVLSET